MAEVKDEPKVEQEVIATELPGAIEVSDTIAGDTSKETNAPKLPPIWRQRNYMLLWSGQIISSLGSGMSGFVLPLLILAITKSPLVAGIAGALYSLPYPLFSLPVGALMDRWNRKQVMIICDTTRAINIATIPIALYFNALTIPQIFLNSFVEGSCFVFFNIAEVAALPRVVDKTQLPSAAAQNEAAFGLVGLISPSIGGFLYNSVSQMFPFIFDAISYGASVFSLSLINVKFQTERTKEEHNLLAEIKEGLVWLWSRPLIRTMAFLSGGFNFVFSGSGLIIIVLAQGKGADAGTIGLIFSIGAIGGILGAIVAGPIAKRLTFAQAIIGTAWVDMLLFPLILVVPNVLLIGVVNAIIFAMNPIYNVVQFSYRLALIPDRLQGRVNSAFRLIAWGSQPLGTALVGVLLEAVGVAYSVAAFAAVLVVLTIVASTNTYIRHAKPLAQVAPVD